MSETCTAWKCSNPVCDSALVVCMEHADPEALRLAGREDLMHERLVSIAREGLRHALEVEKHHIAALRQANKLRLAAEQELRNASLARELA